LSATRTSGSYLKPKFAPGLERLTQPDDDNATSDDRRNPTTVAPTTTTTIKSLRSPRHRLFQSRTRRPTLLQVLTSLPRCVFIRVRPLELRQSVRRRNRHCSLVARLYQWRRVHHYILQAIKTLGAIEGVRPMVLPSNWFSLSVPDQLFVIADLERTARGLPPYLGINDALSANAQHAAASNSDPSSPPVSRWPMTTRAPRFWWRVVGRLRRPRRRLHLDV